MARIIIADSSGHQLNVDQATYDNGFYPGWTYVGPADGGTPISYDTHMDDAMTQVAKASTSQFSVTQKAALDPRGYAAGLALIFGA